MFKRMLVLSLVVSLACLVASCSTGFSLDSMLSRGQQQEVDQANPPSTEQGNPPPPNPGNPPPNPDDPPPPPPNPDDPKPPKDPDDPKPPKPPNEPGEIPEKYSIDQAISDNAQLHTIAFSALAFFTGDLGSDSFFPPGKVSDFFSFQYLRDVDEGEMGHNTSFLTKIANNVLAILTDQQLEQLKQLAQQQAQTFEQYALDRFPLMAAFRRLQAQDLPAGTTGLSKQAVASYSEELYVLDGTLAYDRAQLVGSIIHGMTQEQKAALDRLNTGNSNDWPVLEDQLDKRSLSHTEHVLVMTYASELFSWYAGDEESDTYFCPERHGTYFGAFFMKDMPAMGNPDYTIETGLTGDKGAQMLEVMNEEQQQRITGLVDVQKANLLQIVDVRRQMSSLLREFLQGNTPDRNQFMRLAKRYGKLDGENVYHYATRFAEVFQSLSTEQRDELYVLRDLEGYSADGAFLYSEPIAMPHIIDSDFLFE